MTVTPTSGSSVEIPFGKITFEEAGVYTYTLQENTGDLDKMTYDDGAKTITITVTENENGQLTAVALLKRLLPVREEVRFLRPVCCGGLYGS